MDRLSPIVAATIGALVVAAVWAAVAAARRALRRRRGLARQRHGHAGEQRAAGLLAGAGWRVLDAHPPGSLEVIVDGERFAQPLQADYLCARDGRTLPAEVKTGQAADLAARTTRRQLLEYAVAYRSGATLLVDADAGTVAEVQFPAAAGAVQAPARSGRLGACAAGLLVGALAGLAAGYWLWGARP